jgi:hypothetical protein
MLKLGVCRLDQFPQADASRPLGASQRGGFQLLRRVTPSFLRDLTKRRISYQLLRTAVPPSDREVAVFEYVMARMRLSSGVFRTTFSGRFQGLDEFLNAMLVKHFPQPASLEVHDWAASDCVTSYEWAKSLLPLFPNARFMASDLTLFLVEVEVDGRETFIFEPNGNLLQYVRPPFVVRIEPPESNVLLVNSLIRRHALRKFDELKARWAFREDWINSSATEHQEGTLLFRKLPLIHPRALAYRCKCRRFDIKRHSAFEPLDEPVHVIRTMNIFNLNYFSRKDLAAGVRAVFDSLVEGGVWIVGRTHEGKRLEHDVSGFVKHKYGFTSLDRYGRGSEIDQIAYSACNSLSA